MKTINFNSNVGKIRFKTLTENDLNAVFKICKSNISYYNGILHEESTLEEARTIFTDIPPNINYNQKKVLGCFLDNKLVAFVDVVLGYPEENTAFVGLFMVDACEQGKGVGKVVISQLCEIFARHNYATCQIAVISTNERGLKFWQRVGFEVIGEKQSDTHLYLKLAKKLIFNIKSDKN